MLDIFDGIGVQCLTTNRGRKAKLQKPKPKVSAFLIEFDNILQYVILKIGIVLVL